MNTMTRYLITLPVLCAIVFGISVIPTEAVAAKLYKWIDEDGNVHYSSRLPANQAKNQHQKLNNQGIVVSTTRAAKTEEELAAEAEAKRKEEERLAQEKERLAEEARLKAIQEQKDRVLLMTFSNEDEIIHAREDRIEVINSVIELINKNITSTEQKLAELEKTADQLYTSQGKEIPGGMAQKIEHFTRKIDNRKAQLAQKETEKQKIHQKYDLDMARFRELTSKTN
jgi:hypothetical protein